MGAKIQIKNESVKNFGGFFSFVDHFRKDGMDGIIDKLLDNRSIFAKYSNSDISLSLAAIFLTGGSCIEDSNRLSRIFTENSHGYRFCSADTILHILFCIFDQSKRKSRTRVCYDPDTANIIFSSLHVRLFYHK